MGSILNVPPSPERFYVYLVTNPGDNPKVEYLTRKASFHKSLDQAQLFDKLDDAVAAAEWHAEVAPAGCFLNVARLTLEIDPQFNIMTFEGEA